MKWKQFLPTWLVVFLLAPSIVFPQVFITTRQSPADPGLPLVMPFGAIHWANEWGFLLDRSIRTGEIKWAWDFFQIYFICILPILIYSFFLSAMIYYYFQKVRHH